MLLVGDSTMASRTGYGDALCASLRPAANCVNLARGGRSTKSYREEGLWAEALALARRAHDGPTYVLMQFGHNDQPGKPGRSTDLATEFPVNLVRMVDEVRAAGAVPILVTPLTRRMFSQGRLDNTLRPWAKAALRVAEERDVAAIDLNADSAAEVARLGSEEADRLAMPEPKDFDRTHLGRRGQELFASMMARSLERLSPDLAITPAPSGKATRPMLTVAQADAFRRERVLGDWEPMRERVIADDPERPEIVVDAKGIDGAYRRVQQAVDAAVGRGHSAPRVVIGVQPGIYRELLYVPASAPPITLMGLGRAPEEVRIGVALAARDSAASYDERFAAAFAQSPRVVAEMVESARARTPVGTPGSASTWIRADGFHARNLTFANEHNQDGGDASRGAVQSQAVAVLVDDADRVLFERVRFVGFQDTLYLRQSAPLPAKRTFLHRSQVEGDMDFIFGEATAFFLDTEVRSLGDRAESFLAAPSTHARSPHGFVFDRCRFTNDGTPNAQAGRFKLARQWFRSDLNVGKMVVLRSAIGTHIDPAQPWADWNSPATNRYRAVRYASDEGEPYLAEFATLHP